MKFFKLDLKKSEPCLNCINHLKCLNNTCICDIDHYLLNSTCCKIFLSYLLLEFIAFIFLVKYSLYNETCQSKIMCKPNFECINNLCVCENGFYWSLSENRCGLF